MKKQYLTTIEKFKGLKVLIIGEAMLDVYLNGQATRICREAPVPIVDIKDMTTAPGGAANTAVNLAQLGADVQYMSVVGCDHEAELLKDVLIRQGLDTSLIMCDVTRQTITKQRVSAGDHLLVRFDIGSTGDVRPDYEQEIITLLEQKFHQVDAVVVSYYGYGILTDKVIKTIRRLQRQKETTLVVDAKSLDKYATVGATLVKPNYQELLTLMAITSPIPHGQRAEKLKAYSRRVLKKTGARYVAATMDSEGALLFRQGDEPYRTFSKPVENTKAAGAGDTYVSAFTLALATGASEEVGAEIAQAAALVILQKTGTATCTANELAHYFGGSSKYIQDWQELKRYLDTQRREGKRVVFTNGCFDILHSGHVSYLEQARSRGDVLVLALNSDDSIKRLKGEERPINHLSERIRILSGLESVSVITSFKDDTPINLLKVLKPDVFVKGGDYTVESLPEAPVVQEYGGTVEIMSFVQDRSTTNIITKIKNLSQPAAV
jgi:D-beta-D-heptose 7-phosphate kinase/D-beta-D-heptose 1-phosphate adenosyltransferase